MNNLLTIFEKDTLGLLVLVIVLFVIREGLGFWYRREPKSHANFLWHTASWCIRFFLFGIAWRLSHGSIWLSVVIMFIDAPLYRISCNLGLGKPWWWAGTSTLTDKVYRKIFFFLNFDK